MRIYIVRDNDVTVAAKRPAKPKKSDLIIISPEELAAARLPAKRLIEIWNGLPGAKRLTKISDRAALLDRLWAAFEALPSGNDKPDKAAATAAPKPPRASKQAQVIALLRQSEGATLEELAAATGWQRHTVRGAIAGALKKKLGLTILSEKNAAGSRVYRISA